jgi:hypothetical protein
MKLCQGVALALVGWLLMYPPDSYRDPGLMGWVELGGGVVKHVKAPRSVGFQAAESALKCGGALRSRTLYGLPL